MAIDSKNTAWYPTGSTLITNPDGTVTVQPPIGWGYVGTDAQGQTIIKDPPEGGGAAVAAVERP